MEILLYTHQVSHRLSYVASYVFQNLLTTAVRYTCSKEDFRAYTGVKLNYSEEQLVGDFPNITPHHLLFEQGIKKQDLTTTLENNCPIIFSTLSGNDALAFDPLAASFYLLTRYEEYLPFTADQHGRYTAKESWAYQNDCLHRPIIWAWTQQLKAAIQQYFPAWQPTAPGYQFLPTYDIDIAWAFKHRSWRGWGRTALDFLRGNWPLLRERLAVLRGKQNDPFFVFGSLKELHESSGLRPTIFWLLGDNSRYDINPSHHLPALRTLIWQTSSWAALGIHPSYASFGQVAQIIKEKKRLEAIVSQQITHSRQHFLRFRLPATYRELIAAGIDHDYSMGYADEIGYRAGTTEPFLWYDLEKEEVTSLWIHPFAVMDVTLKNYLDLSPQPAQEKLNELQTYCQNQKLSFSTLWHNSSFSSLHGWSGWWEVYLGLFKQNQNK